MGIDFLELIKYNEFVELKKEVLILSPRTGRPKAENPKANDVKVRLDDATKAKLDRYCEEHGITRAEAIRRGIHLLIGEQQ
nr:MAG: Transcriptional regulator, RHH-like, CopG [Bacteriophage sp.]